MGESGLSKRSGLRECGLRNKTFMTYKNVQDTALLSYANE